MALFSLFLVNILAGVPIAFGFAIAGLIYLFFTQSMDLDNLVTIAFGGLDSFVLMSIPFFIFAGDLMKGGIITHLVRFAGVFTGNSRSALGNITVTTSTVFGAISGSSAASVAAVGSVMIPEMVKDGYQRPYAASVVAASGFIGILIPPSIPLILYGLASGASIGNLFLAGVGPGLFVMAVFIVLNTVMVRRYSDASEASLNAKEARSAGSSILQAIPALLLPVVILGGIYSGVFTPTEAAAVAVFYAILVGRFFYKSLAFRDIPKIALESGITSASIMIIIGFSAFFGRLMTMDDIPAQISSSLLAITDDKVLLLLLINGLLLFLGTFVETATIILLTTPIFLPVAVKLGIDPVHFGIIMVMNLSVGLITPPMALNLFVAAKVSNVKLQYLIRPVLPFVVASVLILLVLTFIPQISLFLPAVLK